MKNLFLLLIAIAFSLPTNADQTADFEVTPIKIDCVEYDDKGKKPTVTLNVEIGRRIKGSDGECDDRFGLCKLKIGIGSAKNAIGQINEDGDLTIEFQTDKFLRQDLKKYLSQDKFIMGEAFKLDRKVANALGVKSYTIEKGEYKINRKGKNYIVVFD